MTTNEEKATMRKAKSAVTALRKILAEITSGVDGQTRNALAFKAYRKRDILSTLQNTADLDSPLYAQLDGMYATACADIRNALAAGALEYERVLDSERRRLDSEIRDAAAPYSWMRH